MFPTLPQSPSFSGGPGDDGSNSRGVFPPLASLMQFLVKQRDERALVVDEAALNRIKTYALLDHRDSDVPLNDML